MLYTFANQYNNKPKNTFTRFICKKSLSNEHVVPPIPSLKNMYKVSNMEMYAMMDELLKKHIVKIRTGDKISGTIVLMDKKFAYVEVGLKEFAILSREEAGETDEELLRVGESREFLVTRAHQGTQPTLSIKALEAEFAWNRIRNQLKSNSTLEVPIVEATKGGYRVDVGRLKAFLPVSQMHPQYLVNELIGKIIPVKLVDVNEAQNRCVCSNRKAIAEDENVTSLLTDLQVGDLVNGYVQNVTAFGAFIDLNGVAGLLHISQISNDRIGNIEGIFHVGEPIKCMVLAIDKEKGRLSLTTKKLEPSPGDMLRNRRLVMEKAEALAQLFRERVETAEAAVKATEMGNDTSNI